MCLYTTNSFEILLIFELMFFDCLIVYQKKITNCFFVLLGVVCSRIEIKSLFVCLIELNEIWFFHYWEIYHLFTFPINFWFDWVFEWRELIHSKEETSRSFNLVFRCFVDDDDHHHLICISQIWYSLCVCVCVWIN